MLLSLASSSLAATPLRSESRDGVRKSTALLLGPANGNGHGDEGLPLKDAEVSFFYSLPQTYLSAESLKRTSFVYLLGICYLAIEEVYLLKHLK